ncbi:hypothetical protein ACQZES_05485 [Corynebacterium diphtheriae]
MPGPVPKRSDQRRRRNKDATGLRIVTGNEVAAPRVKSPRVSAHWHPLMKEWFRSLKESRQSAFYEPSDWQTARLLAEVMSAELQSEKGVNASMLGEFNRAAAALLTTEGERRRLRVELAVDEDKAEEERVASAMESYGDLVRKA